MPTIGPSGSGPKASHPTEDKQIALIDRQKTAGWGNRAVDINTSSTQTMQLKTEIPDIAKVSLGQRFIEKLPHGLFILYHIFRLKYHGFKLKDAKSLINAIHEVYGRTRKSHRAFSESVQFFLDIKKTHQWVKKNYPERKILFHQIDDFIVNQQDSYGFSKEQAFKKFEEVLLKTRRITSKQDQAHSEIEEASFEPIIKTGDDLKEYTFSEYVWHKDHQKKFIDAVNLLGLDKINTLTAEIVRTAYRQSVLKYHPDKQATWNTDSTKFREVKEAYDLLTHDSTELSIVSKIISSQAGLEGLNE